METSTQTCAIICVIIVVVVIISEENTILQIYLYFSITDAFCELCRNKPAPFKQRGYFIGWNCVITGRPPNRYIDQPPHCGKYNSRVSYTFPLSKFCLICVYQLRCCLRSRSPFPLGLRLPSGPARDSASEQPQTRGGNGMEGRRRL